MSETITAIFEDGVFKPAQPLRCRLMHWSASQSSSSTISGEMFAEIG